MLYLTLHPVEARFGPRTIDSPLQPLASPHVESTLGSSRKQGSLWLHQG